MSTTTVRGMQATPVRADGRGHFNVRVVSAAFVGKPPLARHRAVYAAVGEMMQTDIHALSIEALAPGEVG